MMRSKAKEESQGNNPSANLFIDRSCTGCGTCRNMCPGVYGSYGLRSVVHRDALDEREKRASFRAMVTCPMGAIRLRRPDALVKDVVEHDFPMPVDHEALPGIYHLGYHSKDSLGTTPYLIVREAGGGNVMIDAPRFNGRLAKQIEALGGVAYNIITHEGSASHHDMWHAFFPKSERIMHRLDLTRQTADVEAVLNGKGPWTINDDIKIVHLPGYTLGSIGVIYWGIEGGILFSGRTVGWSPRIGQLDGFPQFNEGNLKKQAQSIKGLGEEKFEWILPAEGMKYHFANPEIKSDVLVEAAERFEERGRVGGLTM